MKLTLKLALMTVTIAMGNVFGYQLNKLKMKITDNNREVDNHMNNMDNGEVFSMPVHEDRAALELVNGLILRKSNKTKNRSCPKS